MPSTATLCQVTNGLPPLSLPPPPSSSPTPPTPTLAVPHPSPPSLLSPPSLPPSHPRPMYPLAAQTALPRAEEAPTGTVAAAVPASRLPPPPLPHSFLPSLSLHYLPSFTLPSFLFLLYSSPFFPLSPLSVSLLRPLSLCFSFSLFPILLSLPHFPRFFLPLLRFVHPSSLHFFLHVYASPPFSHFPSFSPLPASFHISPILSLSLPPSVSPSL